MIPPLAAWGLTGTPVTLRGGHRNTVLRVGAHVLKTTRRSEAALEWLTPVHDAAQAAGLRVPRLIRSEAGALNVEGWTCEPYLPGRPSDARTIATRIEAFHHACIALPQRPGFASATDLIMSECGGDVDLRLMPTQVVAQIRQAWSAVAGQPQSVVHGDLGPSNIPIDREGTISLIDWDEARFDLTLFDTALTGNTRPEAKRARLAREIACCWQIEPDRARRLAATLAQ
ncbi:phosphotransferase [uncultured Tateyamaria sp.]|uniref:phosphotransferase n=1 Tax=uncultured Tateyamaria sp. TaxID=455651 RepID=UPI00260CD664|nr:phosphotransferase [uncultured Tateyamaria sp.]